MRLPAAGFAGEVERSPFGDEVGRERRAEHVQAQRRLIREIEIIDRLQKWEVRSPRQSPEPRLLPMGDLLRDQQGELRGDSNRGARNVRFLRRA